MILNDDKLLLAKQYYSLVKEEGLPKAEAAQAVVGKNGVSAGAIERSKEYRAVVDAIEESKKRDLRKAATELRKRQLAAYNSLLVAGQRVLRDAETLEEKLAAQENQRKNLELEIVDRTENSVAEPTPSAVADAPDILEGVIIP